MDPQHDIDISDLATVEPPAEPTADELLRKLNPKRQRFIARYVEHGNALRAAKEAGFSERSATGMASRLLSDHRVRRVIDALMREAGPAPEDIIADLGRIARFDPTDFPPDVYRQEDGRTVVDMEKVKQLGLGLFVKRIATHGKTGHQSIVWYDRVEALALLGKFLGMGGPETAIQVNVAAMTNEELRAIVNGR